MPHISYVLIGQGGWVKKLAEGLHDVGFAVDAVPLDSARSAVSPRAWRRVRAATVLVRVGFRPGAHTWRGRSFDFALNLLGRRATSACYWIGTDVGSFRNDLSLGTPVAAWRTPALGVDHHFAGSDPLRRELLEAGIAAPVVGFPWVTVKPPAELPPFPPQFTVLTYVPDFRASFYGGPLVLEVAQRFPDVRFEVMGGEGTWAREVPANVHFLGWVEEPASLYAGATCVLRLVEHDSIGGTAVEGLLFGRRVLYSEELMHTHRVEVAVDSVCQALASLVDEWATRGMKPDNGAAEWARVNFDPHRRFVELANHLTKLTSASRPPRLSYMTLQATSEGQAAHAHVHEIVRGLAKVGWSVRVLKPLYRRQSPRLSTRLAEFGRIQYRALAGLRHSDAFYIRAHFAALPAAMIARRMHTPVVQEVNGPHEDALLAWPALRRIRSWVARASRVQMRAADAVITVTPQLVRWLRTDAGVEGGHLVSNGADVERFTPDEPRPEGLPARYVIFFGALAPWQGVDIALDATLCAEWPDGVALLIAGDGQKRELVEQRADGHRVVYVGRRHYAEVPAIVSNSLASLLPMPASATDHDQRSTRDHTASGLAPLKMFESMACGVPVIASNLPGIAETITDAECGILVRPGSPEALAKAVNFIANDAVDAERLGRNGRLSAVRDHSWQRRADDTAIVLESLLASGAGRK